MLVILVGLASSRMSKPRNMEGRASLLGFLPDESSVLRNTADSVRRMLRLFFLIPYIDF